MTLQECTAMLTPVALAMRADFDAPTFRAYHRVLKDVPAHLAEDAIQAIVTAGAEFMPTAPKILQAAERLRRQLIAALPWSPCADCEDFPGFRKVMVEGSSQETRQKCPCKARHRSMLQERGLLEAFAELPAENGAGDVREYPTADQLPPGLREQLTAVAGRKALR